MLRLRPKQLSMMLGVLVVAIGIGTLIGSRLIKKANATGGDIHHVNLFTEHADPSAIAVEVGQYVEFDSKDNLTHNIGQGQGNDDVHQSLGETNHDHTVSGLESGDFGPQEGYKVRFTKAGTYYFHDHLHPKISIAVIVYNKSTK